MLCRQSGADSLQTSLAPSFFMTLQRPSWWTGLIADAEDLLSSFITMLTRGSLWTRCWPRRIHSLLPFILICLFLQNQGLPVFSGVPTKILHVDYFSFMRAISPIFLVFHHLVTPWHCQQYKPWSSSQRSFQQSPAAWSPLFQTLCSTVLVCPVPRRHPETHYYVVSSYDERSTCYVLDAIVPHARICSSYPAWPWLASGTGRAACSCK